MIKYGNGNYEKKLDKKGTTLVSNVPISETMEKEAREVIENSGRIASEKQEIIDTSERQKA